MTRFDVHLLVSQIQTWQPQASILHTWLTPQAILLQVPFFIYNLIPGALIPFCAFSGNLSTLGGRIAGLDFPICNQFQPTVLDGQVCYVLDLEGANPSLQGGTQKGKERGLMLALNMDTAKKEEVINSGQEWLDKDIFRTDVSDYSNSATIHLSTLDRFKDTKPGMYAMTSLKNDGHRRLFGPS